MKTITFNQSARGFILSALDKKVDNEGYIVDASTDKKVPSQNGTDITLQEFAGIIKGSEIYVKSDVVSLIEATDKIKAERLQ